MILQALNEYYRRKSVDPDNTDMAPAGWQWKEMPFVLVLDKAGKLVAIESKYTPDKGKNRAKAFLVPQEVTRSSGVAANLLWDKPAYIWGYDPNGKPDRLEKQRQAFLTAIEDLEADDEGIRAAVTYLSDAHAALEQAQGFPEWTAVAETAPFIAFRLDGDMELICERPRVKERIDAPGGKTGDVLHGTCLVTGKAAPIAKLHKPIKGVPGAQTSGAPLVSFNASAFYSYGKKSGDIAPVSVVVEDAYTKALNYLLGKDSEQKIQYGNSTVVFWARKAGEPLETRLSVLLGSGKDDPDARTKAVHSLLNSANKGGGAHFSEEDRFYILGLSPNAARLSVRFWLPMTVQSVKEKLARYFEEIRLEGGKVDYPPLRSLLSSLAFEYKLDNLSPLLEGEVFHSIVSGTDYPQTLLSSALQRTRAERNLPHLRAALIKAYLNRNALKRELIEKEIAVSLDENNKDESYVLGRLFAAYEVIQRKSGTETLRERYYAGASTRPAYVFPVLQKLHVHHLKKMNEQNRNYWDKRVREIADLLPAKPKLTLKLIDQGIFAIGYYHQKHNLLTYKKDETEKHLEDAA